MKDMTIAWIVDHEYKHKDGTWSRADNAGNPIGPRYATQEALNEALWNYLPALDAIFVRHDRQYGSKEAWLSAIKQDLMRWAMGEALWCHHMSQDSKGDWNCQWGGKSCLFIRVPDVWDQCPIKGCHAPRPEPS